MHRIEWPDTSEIDFHLPHGAMLRLLRDTGFEVEALHELRAPEGDDDEVRFFMRRGLGAAVAVRGGLGRAAPPRLTGHARGSSRAHIAEWSLRRSVRHSCT